MKGLRANLRAPGLELRFVRERGKGKAGKVLDLLDLAGCLESAETIRIRARLPIQGRREGDRLELPLGADPAHATLPDRGEITLEAEFALVDGHPALERLEMRAEPLSLRFVAAEGAPAAPVIAMLSGVGVRALRAEPVGADRARLVVEDEDAGEAPLSVEISRRLTGWLPGPASSPLQTVVAAILPLVVGGNVEIDAGRLATVAATLDGPAVVDGSEAGLALPPMTVDVNLAEGRYRLGPLALPEVRGPLRLRARLGPSTLPRDSGPARATGHLECTEAEIDGELGFLGARARVDLRGRGRVHLVRTIDRLSLRFSGVVLRSEGLRIGIEGEPGRDLRLDVTASPLSLTLGWLGAELAFAAQRLVAPSCLVGPGGIRIDQAARCEQLRISFRSPLESGGVSASGAAAMEELEVRGELGRGVADLEPLRIRGLRPSLSLAFQRAGSAAEAELTLGGLLAGHTSLEGLLRVVGGDVLLSARAGDADEGVRLEGGEVELHTPGLSARLFAETGPLQPERIELRAGPGGMSFHMRLGRTVIGTREVTSEVAGAETSFRGEATGELSGLVVHADRERVSLESTGAGLNLRLLGEGVVRMGDTTIRLDRERATIVRLRGAIAREEDGRFAVRIDGGEVQARIGRSEHVRGGRGEGLGLGD